MHRDSFRRNSCKFYPLSGVFVFVYVLPGCSGNRRGPVYFMPANGKNRCARVFCRLIRTHPHKRLFKISRNKIYETKLGPIGKTYFLSEIRTWATTKMKVDNTIGRYEVEILINFNSFKNEITLFPNALTCL